MFNATISRIIRCTILCLFFVGVVAAQQPDPRKWSQADLRMTKLNRTGQGVSVQQAVPEYVPPVTKPTSFITPNGVMTVNPSFRVHPTTTTTQSEVPITRHPTNPNIMYGSANTVDYGVSFISEGLYLTSDGGATWWGSDTTNAATVGSHSGDPAPVITPMGTLIISYLYGSGVGASRSTNMGAAWAATSTLESGSSDKNHTFVDDIPTSPYYGRVYATWSDFSQSLPPAVVSYSTNDGVSWSAYAAVHSGLSGHYDQGVNGVVGTDGAAYIFWQNPVAGSPYTGDYLGMAKSINGGATWTTTPNIYDCNGTRGTITSKASIRINDFPSAGIDKSSGPRRGWIYIVTAERSLSPAGSDDDIVLHRSTDGGTTWSAGVRVNQDGLNNGKIQYMPWLCVDDGGAVNVVFYDDRNTSTDSAMVYVARSLDGGMTWTEVPVPDSRFKPAPISGLAGGYQGDYISITYGNGKVWPYWMSNKSGAYQAWITSITTTEGFGFVEGTATSTLNNLVALSGVTVDFIEPALQQPGLTDATGYYFAGAKVDTPGTTAYYTIRARKFGYVDDTSTVMLTRADTLLKNFSMTPAAGGAVAGRVFRSDSTGVKALLQVRFAGNLVVDNVYSDSATGLFNITLPNGTYDVRIDPPSPYVTRNFLGVVVNSDTPYISCLVRWAVEPSPMALTDTLGVDQSNTKSLLLTNTTADSIPFRLSNDQALFFTAKAPVLFDPESPSKDPNLTFGKGEHDPRFGPKGVNGSGGPDAFGYVWIDSDDPSGPTFNWTDITGVGTLVTFSGTDDGYATVALPFSFPFYGNTYSSLNIVTNGFMNFGATSTAYSNGAIPSTAAPNDAIYGIWDDLNLTSGGTVHYYNDVPNSQFVVQYTNVPPYTGTGTSTFQMILKQSGEILVQYYSMTGPTNSSTIGIENSDGTIGLQVAFNNTYIHDNLALLFKMRGVSWLSHNPAAGTIPAGGSVSITNSFDATGLTPSTTYNANVFVDATHPDVSGSIVVPASLRVEPLSGPGISVTPLTLNYGSVVIGNSKTDSVKIRNIGTATLSVPELSSTNAQFVVTPTSGSIAPGDSMKAYITYSPVMPAGPQSGTIHILSNDPINDTVDVSVSGTGVGVPHFAARLDSLVKTLEGGQKDSIQFYVRNNGTLNGNYAARAVMYPHTAMANQYRPITIPLTISRPASSTVAGRVLIVSDNPGTSASQPDKGTDPDPVRSDLLGVSSSLIYRALVEGGYTVDTVAFSTHNPATYSTYDLIVWSAGANTATMFSDAAKRAALVSWVAGGGKAWVEGGEVGYMYRKSGTTTDLDPMFRRVVLHDSSWVTDASTENLVFRDAAHPIFNTPNALTQPIGFTGTGFGPRDGVRLIPGDTGADSIATWSAHVDAFTSSITTWVDGGGGHKTVFTSFAFGSITDTAAGKKLAQNVATWLLGAGGGGTANWLSINPTSGSIVIDDSTQLTGRFDATDPSIYNNPGNYYGRIEITATNSALAESLNIPARMFVIPAGGPRLVVQPDSMNFGNVEIGLNKQMSVLLKNIGAATLSITNVTSTNGNFVPSPTSFTLNSLDTARLYGTFTAPSPGGVQSGQFDFTSNDALAPYVRVTGRSTGVPHIAATPDSFYFNMPSGPDTSSQAMKIKNTGTDTLRYVIEEVSTSTLLSTAVKNPVNTDPFVELPKGAVDTRRGPATLMGSGGPDAFGYRWIDSDEPGGPTFSWTDITGVGTAVTFSSQDDGYATVPLPFSFPFYGVGQSSVNIVTNGFVNFGATSTAYTNGTIPSTATPNNAVYAIWDDFNLTSGGTVHYYNDVANSQFVIQYTNVPPYTGTGTSTFQVILKQSGQILVQYLSMTGPTNLSTVGIENSDGTIGLQVVYNGAYIHDNLALMFTSDLYSWMSTNVTGGTIAPGDSQNVQVRAHPGLIPNDSYNGKLRISGNTPDTVKPRVHLDVVGGTPYVVVTAPNGGETYVVGQSYNITWNKNIVDTVKIEYSTNNGASWILIKDGTPAVAEQSVAVHPKSVRNGAVASSMSTLVSSYLWTVPNTPTTQALVRVSDKENPSTNDVSNAVFTITATLPPTWSSQTSGTTSALYSVSIVDDQAAWTVGAGGVVRLTTNGGTTWQTVSSLPADAHQVFGVSATTALVCVNPSAGNDGRIYRTTNGGTGWSMVYQNVGTGAFIDAVYMSDASNGLAVGDPVGGQWVLLTTANGGVTWTPASPLAQAGTEMGWNNSFEWTDPQHGWFGSNNSRVYRTTNGGTSWSFGATPATNSYGVSFISTLLGMVGDSGGVTGKSIDGGGSWSAAASAGTGVTFPAGVAIPTQRWWMSSNTAIYKTTDQGTLWTLDHTRSAAFNHIAMKVVSAANVIVGYGVGASGQISKYLEYLPTANEPASISGMKFEDVDGDSVKDAGEPGLAGWKIYLSGTATDTATTDANGYYMFDSLGVGSYTVSEESQTGWVRTTPASGSYNVTLASGDSILGKDFGNFKLGSIAGMKWKDSNGNGVQDPGELPLADWAIHANRTAGAPLTTMTDGSGHYSFFDVFADVYTISEEPQAGYTQTYPPDPGTHTVLMRSRLDTTGLDFGNFYPDTARFRTFVSDSIALAKDNKGKLGKLVTKKADKVYSKFNLIVPSSSHSLTLEFSMDVRGTIYKGKSKLPADSIAAFSGKKPAAITIAASTGDTIQIDGIGVKGKAVKAKYAWGTNKKADVTLYKENRPGLPMPNTINLLAELYAQHAFDSTGGFVVGQQLTGTDASRYGWAKITTYKNVLKSLYEKGSQHTGIPRNFDMYGTKVFVGEKKTVPPSKHNNKLFAELLALKLNIISSEAGKTPVGFGELLYDDGAGGPFVGKTVSEIADQADAYVTRGTSPKPGVSADSLYNVIRAINADFSGARDTLSFSSKLVFTGVKPVSASTILKPNPSAQPKTITLQPGDPASQEPLAFGLYQNYPNPFNPTTTINFDLPAQALVTLKVYDMLGREVASLIDQELLDDGEQSVEFSATHLASGVYFYRLTAEVQNVDLMESDEDVAGTTVYHSVKKLLLMK